MARLRTVHEADGLVPASRAVEGPPTAAVQPWDVAELPSLVQKRVTDAQETGGATRPREPVWACAAVELARSTRPWTPDGDAEPRRLGTGCVPEGPSWPDLSGAWVTVVVDRGTNVALSPPKAYPGLARL